MALPIRPLHPLFGAEVLAPATECPAAAIEAAIAQAGLLLLRNVPFDDAALIAFAGQFGPLQQGRSLAGSLPQITRLSNRDPDGTLRAPDDAARFLAAANRLWHVDNSFTAPGVTFSFLHARQVPELGGDTEFCDNRVTWEALDPARRDVLRGLRADHSFQRSCARIGFDYARHSGADRPPVRRALVRRHHPSGRDALIIASHIERIEGHGPEAGEALLADLTALAAAPERVYRHRWRAGDLLIWDNRCMMHRATDYPQFAEPRDLRSVRVIDVADDAVVPEPEAA